MSPFIITTTHRCGEHRAVTAECAVATRYEVWDAVPEAARKGLIGMTESGGKIGPLPDGTLIEVQAVSRNAFADMLGTRACVSGVVWPASDDEVLGRQIDAFNNPDAA